MFSQEQVNEFQAKFFEAVQQAQTKAAARAREFEQEARKVLDTLGDRAQVEVKVLLQQAQAMSREQLHSLGVELEKLGKKLQELAAQPKAETAPASEGNATPPPAGTVQ